MKVIKVIKRAGWWADDDIVTIRAERNHTIVAHNEITIGMVAKPPHYKILQGNTFTIKIPKRFCLEEGDTVSVSSFFKEHKERFTRIET